MEARTHVPWVCLHLAIVHTPPFFSNSSTIYFSVMSYWFTMILRICNTLSKVVTLPIQLPLLKNSVITYDTDRTRSNVVLRWLFFVKSNPWTKNITWWYLAPKSMSILYTPTQLGVLSSYFQRIKNQRQLSILVCCWGHLSPLVELPQGHGSFTAW